MISNPHYNKNPGNLCGHTNITASHVMQCENSENIGDNIQRISQLPVNENLVTNKDEPSNANTILKIYKKYMQKFFSIIKKILSINIYVLKNRFGIAKLMGLFVVAQQLQELKKQRPIYDASLVLTNKEKFVFETIPNKKLKILIYYPPGYDRHSKENCIVFNNPNAMVTIDHFNTNNTQSIDKCLPYYLLKKQNCPVIFYDYQGTGVNGKLPLSTVQTVKDNAYDVLKFAAYHYNKITVSGTSLGGAAAINSVSKLIKDEKLLSEKIKDVYIFDSFTSIAQVVMPKFHLLGKILSFLFGTNFETRSDLEKIAEHNKQIYIINNKSDDVIPKQARISTYTKNLNHPSIKVHEINNGSHIYISQSMKDFIKNN